MLRIRFICDGFIEDNDNINHYADMYKSQFIDIYLPSHIKYKIVERNDDADICIVGCQHNDNSLLRVNEFNIFYTCENFSVGRPHYKHLNKYGRYGNPLIKLYIYNDECVPSKNILPSIYQRICYFNKLNNINSKLYYEKAREFYGNMNTPFKQKKFCLFISQNGLNKNKLLSLSLLSKFGKIDYIAELAQTNKKLKMSNCYNSYELLKVFNKYKFIICFENSHTPGYITEKIFNVFLSKSIPIYDGDPMIHNFIYQDSYINFDNNILSKVELLINNEKLYNKMINCKKTKELDYTFINNNFDEIVTSYKEVN